jgi:hypothetical protein
MRGLKESCFAQSHCAKPMPYGGIYGCISRRNCRERVRQHPWPSPRAGGSGSVRVRGGPECAPRGVRCPAGGRGPARPKNARQGREGGARTGPCYVLWRDRARSGLDRRHQRKRELITSAQEDQEPSKEKRLCSISPSVLLGLDHLQPFYVRLHPLQDSLQRGTAKPCRAQLCIG